MRTLKNIASIFNNDEAIIAILFTLSTSVLIAGSILLFAVIVP